MNRLLDDAALERSAVVANCDMNRERRLAAYERELGIDIAGLIQDRLDRGIETVRWLDLCCGTGSALLECARMIDDERLLITGVDLVDFFAGPGHPGVRLEVASATTWTPAGQYDLVTCVHGLHYVGDKLGVLAGAASWLATDGLLVANLDVAGVRTGLGRRLPTALRANGFEYDGRRRRITCRGRRAVRLPFRYRGADDRAGPNYTGQSAVNSYYV
ncbi:trans-aconitate 2-methyltransferase [Kutzneria buriramensis]|uniref:Methyltransferase family protein n=1 Tax=Kutzneria buriramensis TaxID=1045776 RepID=A0A3E0I789_9PSEU|nr:methyltransferase domain-containing protein [Kutzneria buriramensis]REH54396.1 methyltransferase family protein [Kutzneria buriramensis]